MALVLNEEQVMLRDAARDFLSAQAPVEHLRKLRDAGNDDAVLVAVAGNSLPGCSVVRETTQESTLAATLSATATATSRKCLGSQIWPENAASTAAIAVAALEQ